MCVRRRKADFILRKMPGFLLDIMVENNRNIVHDKSKYKKVKSVGEDRQVAELKKFFNVNGSCNPQIHYMIDLSERLSEIKKMVDAGEYFTINRARQYGKTTLLAALAEYLKSDYKVISLDFQTISYGDFENEENLLLRFQTRY